MSPPGGNLARFSGFAGLYDAVADVVVAVQAFHWRSGSLPARPARRCTGRSLRGSGLSYEELGMGELEREVAGVFARPGAPAGLVLSWRVRLGVSAAGDP